VAGPPVDFWTEAALFSAAGYPAIVFGSGDIREAHARNESVATDDLALAASTYQRLLSRPR
jgi:acetylornithine deacetylase